MSQPPAFQAPWVPLKYLVERDIVPYALLTMSSFGCMFASLTEWPAKMAVPPYSLSEAMIGEWSERAVPGVGPIYHGD